MSRSRLADKIQAVGEAQKEAATETIKEVTAIAEASTRSPKNHLRPKKELTTRKVKKVFEAALAVPPEGFRWVYNRLPRPYEVMFDGAVYAFDSHEYRLVTDEVANFVWSQSILQYDPVTRRGLRALALDPHRKVEELECKGFGIPMDDPQNVELIDRTADANPLGKVAAGGLKTRPAVIDIRNPGGTSLPH